MSLMINEAAVFPEKKPKRLELDARLLHMYSETRQRHNPWNLLLGRKHHRNPLTPLS